jgi:chromosome segregation ATPase
VEEVERLKAALAESERQYQAKVQEVLEQMARAEKAEAEVSKLRTALTEKENHCEYRLQKNNELTQEIAQLRAEVERLRGELEAHAWQVSPAMAQAKIDQLNAEVTRLKAEKTTLLERLDDAIQAQNQEATRLAERAERAKAALRGLRLEDFHLCEGALEVSGTVSVDAFRAALDAAKGAE